MPDQSTVCICGHTEAEHNDPFGGCASRCLCLKCPPGTLNDCWCASWKPALHVGGSRDA